MFKTYLFQVDIEDTNEQILLRPMMQVLLFFLIIEKTKQIYELFH